MSDTYYNFFSSLRKGLAANLVGIREGRERATVEVPLNIRPMKNGKPDTDAQVPGKIVSLYGSGDIVGFDGRVVVRKEPKNYVGDFEPNLFPSVEFNEHDFPWRYSPEVCDDNGNAKPWISLIVLAVENIKGASNELVDEGVIETSQMPWIRVRTGSLPDLNFSDRWTHVQAVGMQSDILIGEDGDTGAVRQYMHDNPKNTVSRLLCARHLFAGVKYRAFVVPTFELGRRAALGETWEPGEIAGNRLAWIKGNDTQEVQLPYYHSWEFRTGQRGDFEHMVRLLKPGKLTSVGTRPVDCSHPGFNVTEENRLLDMEGAITSGQPTEWGFDDANNPLPDYMHDLAAVLNKNAGEDDQVPMVVPPLYGRWHAQRDSVIVDRDDRHWFNELNLDPRHRMAAALGAEVVRKNQESLMASAWEQLGDARAVRNRINQAQFATEVSSRVRERLNRINPASYLAVTQPLANKVTIDVERLDGPVTVQNYVREMALRFDQFEAGQFQVDTSHFSVHHAVIHGKRRFKSRQKLAGAASKTTTAPRYRFRRSRKLEMLLKDLGQALKSSDKPELIAAIRKLSQKELIARIEAVLGKGKSSEKSESKIHQRYIHSAARLEEELTGYLKKYEVEKNKSAEQELADIKEKIEDKIEPYKVQTKRLAQVIQIDHPNLYPKPQEKTGEEPQEQILFYPTFEQPLCEYLNELSQEYFMPGIGDIKQNTVGALTINRRFIEAFMCGANHEFSKELLWRGYPTDQRGTYFRHFFDYSAFIKPQTIKDANSSEREPTEVEQEHILSLLKDIKPIHEWEGQLSDNAPTLPESYGYLQDILKDNFVLIIRGDLLKKCPNAVIYAVKAIKKADGTRVPALSEHYLGAKTSDIIYPIMQGQFPPDINFQWFPFDGATAIGGDEKGEGMFIVFEERVGETRFGLDEPGSGSTDSDNWSWDDFQESGLEEGCYIDGITPESGGWSNSSGAIASQCFQRPYRMAVHADKLLSSS